MGGGVTGLQEEARGRATVCSAAASLQFAQVDLNSPWELQFTALYIKRIVQHQFIFGSFLIRVSSESKSHSLSRSLATLLKAAIPHAFPKFEQRQEQQQQKTKTKKASQYE